MQEEYRSFIRKKFGKDSTGYGQEINKGRRLKHL